ncbi:MAG: hypothetical protein COA99_18250 [Moraxellaceae bacterium]|nr:MAG: hypothetical protein COA99_18250 [Moraxellaceae bacterium]
MKLSKYFALAISLLLSACSYEIEMTVDIDGDCNVNVNILNGRPQVRYIAVVEELNGKPNFERIVWQVDGNYKKLGRFTYGSVPSGFKEVVSPETLKQDSNFYIAVNGSGGGYGMIKMEYKCLTNKGK